MKHVSYFLFVLIFCLTGLNSCTKKTDNITACSVAWATDLQDEITALSNAGVVYANDPSTENCNAYKATYQAYINALEPYGNCSALTGQSRAAFDQALQDARDSLATLC